MDSKVSDLNSRLRQYDEDLFSKRDGDGVIHVFRKKPYMVGSFKYKDVTYSYTGVMEQHIFSLTEDWKNGSKPRDWGILRIMNYLQAIDSWRDDTGYDEFCKKREFNERDEHRMLKNDLRARALDMRPEFAKAFNEYVPRAGQHEQKIF